MEISTETVVGVALVRITGDLNTASSPELEQHLQGLVADGQRRLVLDLSAVRYVSSAGLRIFLIYAKQLAKDGAFLLSGVTPVVRQVLDMTGFSNIIRIEPTAAEALQAAAP